MEPEQPESRGTAQLRGAGIGCLICPLPLGVLAVIASISPPHTGVVDHFPLPLLMFLGIPLCGAVGAVLGAIAGYWNWEWDQKNGVPEPEEEPGQESK